jgi:coenzyme F420-dependent glucose-6-phosphate dehydrogenase
MPDTHTTFWFAGSHEEFPPSELLRQAQAAEQAGFDGLGCSDHFAPWFPEGQSGQAWTFLGALGQLTELPIGTGVTPVVHHYHPGVIAQAFMSLEQMYPGRVFLGVGSGESLNEVPLGLDWPAPDEKLDRFDKGLEAIVRLWRGETVTMDGGWFRLRDAKLYTRAKQPPRLYVSAFGPQAARIAGKWGDGVWTMGDPETAPEVIEAYRESCAEHDREPGEVIFQSGFAWAEDEQAAIEGAKRWKPTQMDTVYRDDLHDPAEMQRVAEQEVGDEEFAKEGFIVGADPEEAVERIRQMQELGPTTICLQLIGQADPLGSIRTYGEKVLPAVRGARVS